MEAQDLPALETWRRAVDQFRSGKQRINPQLRNRHAGVLGSLLQSSSVALNEVLSDFNSTPPGIVGRAFGCSYLNLSDDKREVIWNWIAQQQDSRLDIERANALPGIFRSGDDSVFRCILDLRVKTKEQRERLASSLAEFDGPTIASLFKPGQEEFKVRKTVRLLLIAADESRIEDRTRAAILEGVLPAVNEHRLHTGSSNFRQEILALVDRLTLHAAARIRQLLPAEMHGGPLIIPVAADPDPAPKEEAKPATSDSSVSKREPEPEPENATPLQPVSFATPARTDITPDPLAWFDSNMQVLARAKQFYVDVRQQYELQKERGEELKQKLQSQTEAQTALSETQDQIKKLQTRFDHLAVAHDAAQKERDVLIQKLENTRQAEASLESRLKAEQEKAQAFGHEREFLSRRIDDHAEGRLFHFRSALSSAITPLVKELPEFGSPRLAELAPNLLVIIRQIINALGDRGIEVGKAAGRAQ